MNFAENVKYGVMIYMVNETVSRREVGSKQLNQRSRLKSPLTPFSPEEKIDILNKYRENSFYAFFIGSPQLDF